MIGIVLVVLSLAVLFRFIPGNEVAWLIVLVCGLLTAASLAIPQLTWPWPRRRSG